MKYLTLTKKTLSAMAELRIKKGEWIDSEDDPIRETRVFKIGECLRPFYLAAHEDPNLVRELPMLRFLLPDTKYFLENIAKDGFFPSPYSPIPEVADQYIDFAAFSLELCTLIYDFWHSSSTADPSLLGYCKQIGQKAFNFLLEPDNRLTDHTGSRWGGTNKYSRTRKHRELYTSTYFTSVAILSLHHSLDHPILDLSSHRREQARSAIANAGDWISARFDGEFITGDELKTHRKLLFSTWGLRALIETHKIQDEKVQQKLGEIISAFIDLLESRKEFFEQEYVTILSEAVDVPLYYEDRSGLGGLLLTLCSIWSLRKTLNSTNEDQCVLISKRILTSVLELQNHNTNLWYRDGLILSVHSYLVEAFLKLSRLGVLDKPVRKSPIRKTTAGSSKRKVTNGLPIRNQIFISYSHRDKKWLQRLQVHLKPLERLGAILSWDDAMIVPGSRWRSEIRKGIKAAKVAVLLVSADFLASDFIVTNELPPLLEAAETQGAIILPVIVSPCRFLETSELSKFQCMNPPSQPLILMTRGKQEAVFVKLTQAIERALGA